MRLSIAKILTMCDCLDVTTMTTMTGDYYEWEIKLNVQASFMKSQESVYKINKVIF